LGVSDATSSGSNLAFERTGAGEPLLLLHGTGSSRAAWKPVIPLLASEREVIALDLPGHGDSPRIAGIHPSPIGYAPLVAQTLKRLGLGSIDVAGNSMGAWTGLELAKLGWAQSVVCLGAAGLWPKHSPLSAQVTLWLLHHAPPPPPALLRSRLGRKVLLRRIYGQPERIPPEEVLEAAAVIRSTRGFDEHLRATTHSRFTGGRGIDAPLTIAYGERDRLVPKRARRGEELPAQARWTTLPRCGHVPTWDDPELIARTILEGTRAPRRSGS
jgi:pimeloyl-ACP methyl ester carboxylesterase